MSDASAQLDPATVQTFVANAHGDLDVVRSLLAEEPALINAAWDWGGGDWETGLGAAAHMGRRQIALFLLEHGARLDLFAASMLGYFDIVSAVLSDFPDAEILRVQEMVSRAADAVSTMVELGVESAMNTFNGVKGQPE